MLGSSAVNINISTGRALGSSGILLDRKFWETQGRRGSIIGRGACEAIYTVKPDRGVTAKEYLSGHGASEPYLRLVLTKAILFNFNLLLQHCNGQPAIATHPPQGLCLR